MEECGIYVLNTDVLINYKGIIKGDERYAAPSSIDLSRARLVIPMVVVRELAKIGQKETVSGNAAKAALGYIRAYMEDRSVNLRRPYNELVNYCGQQSITILPLQRDFAKFLPFCSPGDDVVGQVVLSAMAASIVSKQAVMNIEEMKKELFKAGKFDNITLLTNDDEMAILARAYGVKTSTYVLKYTTSKVENMYSDRYEETE